MGDEPNGGRRGQVRGGRLLFHDPAWQQLLTSLSQKVDRMLDLSGSSIAAAAADASLAKSAVQDVLKTTTDPKLSTLYRIAKARGYRLYVFFEPDPPSAGGSL
jgi:DNA-binding phage protein